MKKRIFAPICALVLMGCAFSACSSDDDSLQVNSNPETYRVFTDYICDINNEIGVVYRDYFVGGKYIDAANGNRYYFLEESKKPDVPLIDSLEEAGILDERNVVKFSGKVYDVDERWLPDLKWRLEKNGWNDYIREHQIQLELPTEGHVFFLVAPDFTIENAE